MSFKIERRAYVDMFGPTTGDRVQLEHLDLIIEVEKDFTTYGEEVKFGGGKVIRDGMGPVAGHATGRGARHRHHQCAGPRSLGDREVPMSGFKDRQDRRASARPAIPTSSPASRMVIGPGTEVIAGEGKILTASGFDTHIHFICPQQVEEALMSGRHLDARRRHPGPGGRHQCHELATPGPWHLARA